MTTYYFLLAFFSFNVICSKGICQCDDIPLIDSSFQEETLIDGGFPYMEGVWYRDDGCELNNEVGYHGETSACSNGGGAFQVIPVQPNTEYYLSCYVLNGKIDPFPALKINWIHYPINPPSDDWNFVSQTFDSGLDTVAIVGFYSDGACFDLLKVTCNPIVGLEDLENEITPYLIYPTIFSNQITIETSKPCTISVLNLAGQIIEEIEVGIGQTSFGQMLLPSSYLIRILSENQVYLEKVIKLE